MNPVCPDCKYVELVKIDTMVEDNIPLNDVYYKCPRCGQEYDKEMESNP